MYSDRQKPEIKISAGAILLGLLLFFGFMGFLLSFETVQAGQIKVVTRFGKVTGRVLEPGAHFITPFSDGTKRLSTKKVIYETLAEENHKNTDADYIDYPVDTNTSDGQPVDIYYTIRFSVDPTKATWVVQNIGSEENLVEKVVKTESRIWARNVPRNFTADALYQGTGTEEIQNEIFNRLQPIFSQNGLVLDSVGIREVKFSDAYVASIEEKQIEEVKVETEKNRALQAEERKKATISNAEAEAEAQRLQGQTLDSQVLEKLALEVELKQAEALRISAEKGQKIVPDTILGSDSNLLFNLK